MPTLDERLQAPPDLAASLKTGRIVAVDMLRGAIMIVMALDHTRDFFTNARIDPTNLDQTNVPLFWTRWVTHFCAPNFVFLAGASAFLYGVRVGSRGALSRHLLMRGLWLVFLELTVVRFGLLFNLNYNILIFQVIWVIGVSMVALAGLVWLPRWLVLGLGLAMIAGHNVLDGTGAEDLGVWAPLWRVLHEQGAVRFDANHMLFVAYPLVPWVGVMAAGFGFGPLLMEADPARRHRRLLALGFALCAAFVVLRALNVYGDPRPWQPRGSPLWTFLAFVNGSKYPPSLLFLLMTIGPALAVLPMLERLRGPVATVLVTFGRVPLFFYIAHFYLIHTAAAVAAVARYGLDGAMKLAGSPFDLPAEYGYSLPVNYLIWLGVVATLYVPCRWFARLKQRRRDWWWLGYL